MDRTLAAVVGGIVIFIEALSWVIFADILMAWIAPDIKLREFTQRVVAPITAPFRKLSDKIVRGRAPIDLSPTLALVTLYILSLVLGSLV